MKLIMGCTSLWSDTEAVSVRLRLKCDGTHAETRFRLSAKRTSPFKSSGASVHSTTASRFVRVSSINDSNAGYTMFRGSVKSTGYPLHSPVSPTFPLPCVTVCHHVFSNNCNETWIFITTVLFSLELRSSGLLRNEQWQFITDVSGPPISPIPKYKKISDS
jgi:hypothetical protein